MANDDRDRQLEKALARQLRSSAAEDSSAQNIACPDAEILAAYHERSLSLEELASWKKHIAGCARCQEILAQVETTDELPVAAEEVEFDEVSLVSAGAIGPRAAARELTMAAAPAQMRATSQLPRSERAPVATLPPRKMHWRWIAPAGAIAAGLLVWIVLNEKPTVRPPQPPQPEVALNREPEPTPTSTARGALPAKVSPALPADKKKESAPQRQVSPRGAYVSDGISSPPPKLAEKKAEASPPEPPILTADATLENRSLDQGGLAGGQKQGIAPKPPSQANNSMGTGGALAALSAKRARTPSPAAAAAPAPPANQQSQQAVDQTVTAQTETVQVTSAVPTQSRIAVNGRTFQDLRKITAPDGHTVWMVGPTGFVQRSDDAGKSWKRQQSGMTSDLRAGSAPSPKICWVVGSAGAILRTTDGGKNWEKLTSPTQGDLDGVIALDALHATVTDAANKTSFVTNDGGMTWSPVAGE